ncbi:alanine racemase [Erythrobacter sp. GH3-10]|uniref:alanine racemase n=2 Tax=Aurantiacibacter rhizosphaerae TaxID=2691582 RepID=A0A844XEL4_9SPHN|nr:alanine racemase [Aurantiacibacter rhizosphaerae]
MTLPDPPPATLRLRIDTDALAANWRALDRLSGSAEAGAAVKADGYGLGIDHVMPALLSAGARHFFVAHWSEVPDVLRHTDGATIAVLHGVTNESEANYAKATGAIPVLNSLHQAQIWLESGGGPCHLMVDSGINRLGVEPDQLGNPLLQRLEIDTLLSHLASADEDSEQNARQQGIFRQAIPQFNTRKLSLANSAGIALGSDYHFDITRPGLSLYGGVPRAELSEHIQQVAYLEAAVLQLRDLSAGDAVGYNATWRAERSTRVAVLSLGYADGFLRSWGAEGALQHNGQRLPILGRVSMDMVIVDCSDVEVQEGDFCQVIYGLPQASKIAELSQYELLTVLGSRFDRVS